MYEKRIIFFRIHKEGLKIVSFVFLLFLILNFLLRYFFPSFFWFNTLFLIFSILFCLWIVYFFRVPQRAVILQENKILAPADGKIVVIEKTFEKEYFNDERILISIFMSPLNVHVNWIPISGKIVYSQYHPGKYKFAWKPKASEENERFTVVIKCNDDKEIMVRQIAGKIARRIVAYLIPDMTCTQGQQFGMIKFGSRVDIFLPLGSKIFVSLNQKVKGNKTIIAEI
ncbi:MAG: phosphatidylserine decarboxylase family protein [Bacteroidales bacterium]|nr:phosphatidylserine decarboxylase family protein [Bacteroidales bacterium]